MNFGAEHFWVPATTLEISFALVVVFGFGPSDNVLFLLHSFLNCGQLLDLHFRTGDRVFSTGHVFCQSLLDTTALGNACVVVVPAGCENLVHNRFVVGKFGDTGFIELHRLRAHRIPPCFYFFYIRIKYKEFCAVCQWVFYDSFYFAAFNSAIFCSFTLSTIF